MKRDLELIRKIVLAVEDQSTGFVLQDLKFEGYTAEQVGYHNYLLIDSGLAVGPNSTTLNSSSPSARILHLTSAGHDFADAARDEGRWSRASGIVKEKAGGATIEMMKDLLVSLAKNALGI